MLTRAHPISEHWKGLWMLSFDSGLLPQTIRVEGKCVISTVVKFGCQPTVALFH